MERVEIPWKAWVVVCDGAKALILQNEGDAELVNLKTVNAFEGSHAPNRELDADKPGRVQESANTGRSAMEETDHHAEAEVAFLAKLAGELGHMVQHHEIKHLIVVAPPRALGTLREKLDKHVQDVIQAEVHKDLVHLPTYEIEQHLAK
ncbi:host attachment protein [Methyloligella sp. 2.7D]|uniref:baeRF12 domain-containing protein n=1 Tax=unclassified Methyloligella TaxID=2625955 RepID=UPI00157C957F|nr:host attachment protein [Methyloligella sp. GL2]QKP76503.1 host attachment protein [Methyloligella sp. GL2]